MSSPLHGDALLKALAEVGLALQPAQTVDGVVNAAGDGLRRFGLSFAVLERDGELTRIRHANIPPEVRLRGASPFEGMSVPMSQLERVAQAGRGALLIGDVRQETEKFYERYQPGLVGEVPKFIDQASFQRVAMQTLFVDGELWGGFTLGSPDLAEADVPAVTLFGVQLNAALQRVITLQQLEQRRRELEAVNAIATTRLEGSIDARKLLEQVAIATGSDAAAFYTYDATANEYVMVEPAFGTSTDVQATFRRFTPPDDSEAGVLHLTDLSYGREVIEAAGFTWFGYVPLKAEGRASAWLGLARKRLTGYTKAELATAALLGVQVNAAVERARLYAQLSQRVRQLTLLFELARSGVSAREAGPLFDRLLSLLVDNLPCDAAALMHAHGTELLLGSFRQRAGSGQPLNPSLPKTPFDDSTVTGQALRYQKAMKCTIDDAPERSRRQMLAYGTRHMMAAPIVVGERHYGALLVTRLTDLAFTNADLELLESCSAQASVLVEHMQLFDDLRQSYSSLEKAQAEVVRHERLAALGELAAVMAHEVRNPLGVIFNSLTSLKRRAAADPESALLLGIVGEEADRLNRIVGDLLDFARPYEAERSPIEIEPIVASAVEAAFAATNAQVKVVTQVARELPRFVVDGHLVRQAVLNLVVNAIQAMPKGGTVTVKVSAQQKNGSAAARIEVEDEGVGISPQTEKHIFQPFFTTKATGTGLGLAVVKRIVDAHHGEISVRRARGGGTTFTVTLPSG
ncbi:MAG: GAF domain-containing protein [Myxococcaceae bacterium]|nr:GAF domain-containing protein [Myxococcaceae bacterium]